MTIKKTNKNRKYYKNGKNIKQIKHNKNIKNIKKYTQKLTLKNNNLQKGGNIKEQFELKPLSDFDYDKYKLSNYMNDNINWGKMPGSPPMPTCSIL